MNPKDEFAQRLSDAGKALRKRKDWSLDELWVALGIEKSSWYNYTGGKTYPDFGVAIRLQGLGINLNWLASGDGNMFGESPLSEQAWADFTRVVSSTVQSKANIAAKVLAIVGYVRGLLDVPEKPDNIPNSVNLTEAANDGGTVRQGDQRGPARDASGK